ncbi:DUF6701 domain-containing protein [Shewanella sp. YLB-07]|uniref:DUF6701 domain-containing protein n=1 Tax=Shewanella sp. YLB-07 TaxID=2601268 RepID=UPI002AD502BE|nr:DUF6701 domain-containing protein [Shewanella sp. YLB-07]
MINTIKHPFAVVLLFIFSGAIATAEATDWSLTFIEGANSFDKDGEIKFENSARLNNAPQNGQLPAPKVDDSGKACYPNGGNAKKCKKSNQLAQLPAERVNFSQCKSNSNNNIGPPSNGNPTIDVPEGEYGDVKLEGGSNRTIRFTTVDGIYKLKTLQAKSGRLELSSGQYWIGNLEINQGVTIVFPSTGTVSFFIDGGYDIVNDDSPADPTRFLIYSYDDIKLMGGLNLNAYLVGEDDVLLEGSSTLNGAVTSEEIELKGGAVINFINRTGEINVIPDCNAEPVLPVVPLQCPAEQAGVAGITYRTYDATNWKPGQYTSPVDHDDFNDLVATVKTTINQLGESIESRIEGYGVNISPHSNQGDNYAGIFEGYLDVPETGNYTFGIDGDDSIELLIDDQVVVGFYGLHGQCGWPCRTGDIALAQGTHKIEMRFHEATGAEAYHLYWQPPSASSPVKVPESAYLTCPFPQFEFGRVSLGSGSAVINFENSYATAPVVMLMPTIDGETPTNDGPSSVRLVSSSATTANISQNDPPGNRVSADDMPEVDYFVMESGYRFLARGKALQAGKIETEKYQGKRLPSSGRGYEDVSFWHKFGAKPAMVGQTLTRENNRFITTVINNVSSQGDEFDIAIEASEVNGSITQDETLGYVAGLGSGSLQVNGEVILYEFDYALNHSAGGSTRTLTQQCAYSTNYENTYPSQPYLIANKNSRRGGDGGWIRRCRQENFANSVSFVVDEDQLLDAERNHLAEDIGYFAFEAVAEPPATNHYRIEFSSGAISCAAKDILIRACANTDCTAETSVLSTVDLTKNGGVYSTINFTGHTIPPTSLWHTDGGVVVVGLGATAPSGSYRCFIDGTEVLDIDQCKLVYEDTGFYFDVPNTSSCKDTASFELFAVKKDSQTQECVPLFSNQTKAIDFNFEYKKPSSVSNEASLILSSLHVPTAIVSIDGGDTKSLNVSFDTNGKAELKANYPEAGVVTLKASHIHSVNTPNGTEELLLEYSDDFTAAPAGFHFFNISSNKTCIGGDPYGANCEVFAKAGEDFNMGMKAVCWESDGDTDFSNNTALQNFQLDNIGITAKVDQPSTGSDGSFGDTSINFDLITGETSETIVQSWSEVGTVTASLSQDLNYEGVTITQDKSSSEVFGRFTPAYLEIIGNTPEISHACGSFTYIDQPFSFLSGTEPKIQAIGKSTSSSVTSNYQIDPWWRYKDKDSSEQNRWSGRSYSDNSSIATVDDRDEPALSGTVMFSSEPAAYLAGAQVNYLRTASAVAPFNALFNLNLLALDVTDDDGICFQSDANSQCIGFTFTDIGKDKSMQQRYGRMILENGYGPESESLRLPIRTEYVGSVAESVPTWVVNDEDQCSIYNTASSSDNGETVTTGMNMQFPTGFPSITAHSNDELTLQSGIIQSGINQIYFTVPNATGVVPLKQHVAPWLKWYWNYDASNVNGLYDPRASAFFGTYRGHDKVIYWREVN